MVGAQKVVPDLATALRRIETYAYPLEDARARVVYGRPSATNHILIINGEPYPGRSTVLLLPTALGRTLAAHTRLSEAERAYLIALSHGTSLQPERPWTPPDRARRTLEWVGQERGWRPEDGWRGLVLHGRHGWSAPASVSPGAAWPS